MLQSLKILFIKKTKQEVTTAYSPLLYRWKAKQLYKDPKLRFIEMEKFHFKAASDSSFHCKIKVVSFRPDWW